MRGVLTTEQLDDVTTQVGNALTALDDPEGIPDLDADDPYAQIDYAKGCLCEAMDILHPCEEHSWTDEGEVSDDS